MDDRVVLKIDKVSGRVTMLATDAVETSALMQAPGLFLRRASNVEPLPGGGWTVDLSLSGGPTLGPYATRKAALAAEHAWLNVHVLGARPVDAQV